ncbi:hypothetical protein KR018_008956 [Drosophila ironensis]|nr:hypothetical protein KR018_008956 [Drosophila ironensis]
MNMTLARVVPLAVVLFCAVTVSVSVSAAASTSASASASAASSKPKRDAGLSFGGVSSYHGPSHKYLPPAYDGHLSFGGYHGSSLGPSSGSGAGHAYSEYAHLDGGHGSGHHGFASFSRPGHHYGSGGAGGGPKIETYIVQTSSGSAGGHGYGHAGGHSGSHFGGSYHGGHGGHGGYKYASPASGASSYLNLLGGGHKTSTYLVASPEYSYGAAAGGGRPSYSAHSNGYSHGFGHHISHGPSHGPSHGQSHSLDHALEHALEHGLTHALGLGHGSGGGHGSVGSHFGQHPIPAEEHSGYSYEAPATPFHGKGAPLSSYGVPLIPGYDEAPVQVQVLEQEQKAEREQERETPVYALGHKGLGHFSYTASKPQALHTDVISGHSGISGLSGLSGLSGHSAHSSSSSGGSELELSKAPFKPSAFLGAKHEGSSAAGGSSGYDYATPSSPFLQAPPSSPGYDYQAPAQLYGPPGHSGDSATPIFEPEATYLPPTHGYH